MTDASLLHEFVHLSARRTPAATALTAGEQHLSYEALDAQIGAFASGLMALGIQKSQRVAVFLEKRFEMVVACFGAAAAGAVFVPLNPLLKPEQVGYILRDCGVKVLVTSADRLALLTATLGDCADLAQLVVVDAAKVVSASLPLQDWNDFMSGPARVPHRVIDSDMLSILYTSGSTGRPKGVVLSHRNMVAGAKAWPATWTIGAQTRCWPRCRCRLMPVSASSPRPSSWARAWCC